MSSQRDTDLDLGRTSRLEPNFTIEELAYTGHTEFAKQNLAFAWEHWSELKRVATMLQHIRDHFGKPVHVHSGIRCPALNDHIGGSPSSQHMRGEAADFHVQGVEFVDVFDWIRNESGLKWGQIILEGDPPSWIHMSLVGQLERTQQVLTWKPGEGYRRIA
ncbi:hypothetical protein H8E07_13440 [bacterium]|nr:hypothetical protein [bacterium]